METAPCPQRSPSYEQVNTPLVIKTMSLVSSLHFLECFMVNVWLLPYRHLCDFGMVAARADSETLAVPAALPFPS